MKRVLIVSPSFPPTSTADLHRVRTSLPFYREFGWQPLVLAVSPEKHGGLVETDLLATIPAGIDVVRTNALPAALTRLCGIGNVAFRAWPYLHAAGSKAIRSRGIDLVYFSTTMFPAVALGRVWKARFGTPYVIDMQDPWKTDYRGAGLRRGVKARAARLLHGALEPFAMRQVDGIVSVSAGYSDTLRARYAGITADMCTTIPFGASAEDFATARQLPWRNDLFNRRDGRLHGVSVGRGGRDLAGAAAILFRAIKLRADRSAVPSVRLTFVGTDYASAAHRPTIAPIADALGLADLVDERPARVPFLAGLRLLSDGHFTIVLGSDDPAYSPSKIYPYLMTGRPFVAVLHHASPVVPLLQQSGTGVVVTFGNGADPSATVAALADQLDWIYARTEQPMAPPAAMVESFGAREMTRRQCAAFEAALRHASPEGVPCVE